MTKNEQLKRLKEMLHTLYENKYEPDKLWIQIPRYHREMKSWDDDKDR